MTIERDLRNLLSSSGPAVYPDKDNWLARKIFTQWLANLDENEEPHVRSSTAPFWASDGATCARKLSYALLQRAGLVEEASNPPTLADRWRFHLGNVVHDDAQSSLPDDLHEVRAILHDDDGNELVSCRADTVVGIEVFDQSGPSPLQGRAAVEIKSMNGYGFKMAVTSFKGPPEGPRWGAVVQLALTVKALRELPEYADLTHGIILLVSLENISPNMAKDFADSNIARFAHQFTYTVEELDTIANEAVTRFLNIRRVVGQGTLAPRVIYDPDIPRAARIVNPAKGQWELHDRDGALVRAGETWLCGYCDWRDQCIGDGPT